MAITSLTLDTFTLVYFGGFGILFVSLYSIAQRISNLEGTIAGMIKGETKAAAAVLHSPHTPEADLLLDKFIRNESLSTDELDTLKRLLELENGYDDTKKLAKALVLKGIDYLLAQKERRKRWYCLGCQR